MEVCLEDCRTPFDHGAKDLIEDERRKETKWSFQGNFSSQIQLGSTLMGNMKCPECPRRGLTEQTQQSQRAATQEF